MNHSSNPTAQMPFDFEVLSTEALELSPETIEQAVELSLTIPNEERQWQAYLNALAMFGFEQWLNSRATDLTLDWENCSTREPATANAIEAVCNLKVNDFKLCLIATGSLTDEEVMLPRAIVDLPEFIPHFYVLVEVQEEQEAVTIQGFLSRNQLDERLERANLVAEEDWTYQLPASWFIADPDRLLLYLSCLEPTTIPLPTVPSDRSTQLAQLRSGLERLLPELHSSQRQLWQILTWEQGAVVLTNPELLNWVYQVQQQGDLSTTDASARNHLTDILQLLTQQAMNVRRWLSNELDELAQELSWILLPMPSLATATALRSPTEEFEAIVRELHLSGLAISPQARGAYRDLQVAGLSLRLYALTWPLMTGSIPEWTLLLILGAPSETNLPIGLTLRVSDQTGILVERVVGSDNNSPYFFTSVIGNWYEKFIVTIGLAPGFKLTLPPFSFQLEP
jgi:hypothetical protein